LQGPAAKSELIQQGREHVEHFNVSCRRLAAGAGRPNRLRADLVELAIAAFLWTLTAELRPDVIELLKFSDLVELVLDVGAHHASSVLGAQGQRLRLLAGSAALVFPGKHLFGDDVGFFADAAGEQAGIFKYRSADLVEVVAGEDVAHLGLDPVPQVGIGREKITSSADGANHKKLPVASSQLPVKPSQ
jgi:hypothetical protein